MTRFFSAAARIVSGLSVYAVMAFGSAAHAQNIFTQIASDFSPSAHYARTVDYETGNNSNTSANNGAGENGSSGSMNCDNCNSGCQNGCCQDCCQDCCRNGCDDCGNCGCGHCGCDNCGCGHSDKCGFNRCDDGCPGCCDKWYVQGGAVFLWRNNDAVRQPVVISSIDQSTLLDTQSTSFDTGIGPRILVGYRVSPHEAWAVSYFGAFDFDGGSALESPGSLAAPGSLGQQGTDWSFADAMSVSYRSEINDVEITHLRNWGNFWFMAGFRFLDLNEHYNITTVSGADTSFYNIRALNDLYGFQIGGRYRQCCHRFFWDVTGKGGVFGNAAEQSQYLSDNNNTTIYRDNTESHKGTVAFIGDLNISVGYQISPVWTAKCGYNLMWIDQVALAPDQLNFDISSPGTNISTSGDVFLQGIDIGLEARW